MKKAFITGITGQDGSYLAEFLLNKGYEVHGLWRRSSTPNTERINHLQSHLEQKLFLHYGDLSDASNLTRLLYAIKPDEVYNLAAQSHAHVSFEVPEYTADVNGLGALRVLDAIRESGMLERTRFYQAGAAEMYGKVQETPQRETTPFHPHSPYAAAKVFAHWTTVNHRESYGMFACNGIAFGHESPRRDEMFVTRKITRAVARIKFSRQDKLRLGNLDGRRDWGYAKEYVEAMWLMLQQEEPNDYVLATGEVHSVRELLDLAFGYVDLDWRDHVVIDPRYSRPVEIAALLGDASKIYRCLGWEPETRFQDLVRLMVDADLALEGNA